MRIGLMADVYKPHLSGVTNYIYINKLELERLGHEVFVFAFGNPQKIQQEANIIISPGLPLQGTYYVGIKYSRRAIALMQTMDIVHLHHPFLSGRLAVKYCKPRGIPLVFTNHTRYDLYMQYYAPWLPKSLGMGYLKRYLPAFCRKIDLVISPSEGLRRVSMEWGVDSPIMVIPNGIDLTPFMEPSKRVKRGEIGLSDDHIVLLYVGRVVAEKNLQFVFRAFRDIHLEYPQARLVIVGDGAERKKLERLALELEIQAEVIFTGQIPYSELPGYIHLGDVFVTASTTEVHPFTLIEANACGLPVVGIDSPGVSDTIRNGITGYITPDSFEKYVEKLKVLVENPILRKQMGGAAQKTAEEYSIKRTAKLVFDQYERLINLRRGVDG
jgi:1,2-diacylglycerol 3-alpha-glucosyltransferase